jgi:hypothetical protein
MYDDRVIAMSMFAESEKEVTALRDFDVPP